MPAEPTLDLRADEVEAVLTEDVDVASDTEERDEGVRTAIGRVAGELIEFGAVGGSLTPVPLGAATYIGCGSG